jgi:hypothetical protein
LQLGPHPAWQARQALKPIAPPASDLGADWPDWLIRPIALREAEALILHDPDFPADPFALSGIVICEQL